MASHCTKKHFLAVKSALFFLTIIAGTLATYAQNFTAGNLHYTIIFNGSAVVTGVTDKNMTSVTIPTRVSNGGTEYEVSAINYDAFSGCRQLKELVVEDGASDLLSSMKHDSSGYSTPNPFADCPLEKVYYGRNHKLKQVSGGYDYMKFGAGIKEFAFGAGVKEVFYKTLQKAVDVEKLTIGGNVVSVKYDSKNQIFAELKTLRHLVFDAGTEALNVDHNIFKGYETIETIYVDRNIDCGICSDLPALKKITFGPNADKWSFMMNNCQEVTELIFEDGTKPFQLWYSGINSLGKIEKLYIGRDISKTEYLPENETLTDVRIGNCVTELNGVFNNSHALTSLEIPSSVKKIISCEGLSSIESLTIPASVEEIGWGCFRGWTSLKELILEDGPGMLTKGGSPFPDSAIETFHMGRHMNDGALEFSDATRASLSKVTISGEYVRTIWNNQFSNCVKLTEVEIPEGVENIFYNSFSSTGLTSVRVPSTAKTAFGAFNGCAAMKELIFADADTIMDFAWESSNVERIYMGRDLTPGNTSDNAFTYFESLTELEIGPKVTELGQEHRRLLFGAAKLEKVVIPANVKKYNGNAIVGAAIAEVIIEDGETPLEMSGGFWVQFTGWPMSLKTVYVGRDLKYEESPFVCYYGMTVEDATIGKNVTSIPKGLLEGNHSLKAVKIESEKIESVAERAFYGCVKLDSIEIATPVPPVCGQEPFAEETYANAVLYVPSGSRKAYREAEVWKRFYKIRTIGGGITVNAIYDASRGSVAVNGQTAFPAKVEDDTDVNIEITPAESCEIERVMLNGQDITAEVIAAGGRYTVTAPEDDIELQVSFARYMNVEVVVPEKHGKVTLNGTETANLRIGYGQPLSIVVTPDEGFIAEALTVNDETHAIAPDGGECKIDSVVENLVIRATFAVRHYEVRTACKDGNGIITVNGNTADVVEVAHGSKVTIDFVADEGFELARVLLNGTDITSQCQNGSYTIDNVKSALDVEAEFKVRKVRLSVLGLEGGRLSQYFDYGQQTSFAIEPDEGWKIHAVTINGTDVPEAVANGVVETGAMTDDCNLSVVFTKDSGVSSVGGENDIAVRASDMTIRISGAAEGAECKVYDTAGINAYSGTRHTIELGRHGIYIVVIEGRTFKVGI